MNNSDILFTKAKEASQKAYAPYSKFKVGCAILASSGNIYSGCNVENVSYPVGTCAEAGAIAAMVNGGDKKISAVLVYADSNSLISPCGACRQRIAEFADSSTIVYLADAQGIQKSISIEELLPLNFKEF